MVKKLFQTLRHAEFTVQIRSNAIKVMTLTALLTYITGLNTGNDVLEASQACQAWHTKQCCKVKAETGLQTNPKAILGFYTQTLGMRSKILSTVVNNLKTQSLSALNNFVDLKLVSVK